ncbi:MAG: PAS domain S-box protein [Thermoguttaceae bacterium]
MVDQDKTKQQLLEELAEMRRRETQWRSIIANTPVFVAFVDRAGTIQYLNHMAPGHALEDTLGKSVYDFIEPAYREIARGCIERVFNTGQTGFYEPAAAGPNGSISWYETYVGPVKVDGQVIAVTLVSNDITRRKQAEEALIERESQLLEAQEIANLGFYVFSIATGRWTSSSVLDRILGIPADYARTVDGWGDLVHPEERQEMLDYFLKEVMEGKKPFNREYRIVRYGDQQARWVHGLGRLQFNEGGQVASMLGTIQDITERKQADKALQKVAERKRAQEALAKEYHNLKHLLQSSDHERQLIAYEIHDGLAQQLAGALMQFQAFDHLKDNNPKAAANAYHAAMTMLQQGHFEARRLIAGVRPPILDESGVVEAVAHLVHEEGRDGGPKIDFRSRVDFDRLDPTLENAIYRIAQEGLTNACKHSQSERIWVRLLQRGDRIRIEIRDWGVGFDPNAVSKSRFGLEGIRQRARLLGGKCSIRSMAGKGARVSVELPVVLRDEGTSL